MVDFARRCGGKSSWNEVFIIEKAFHDEVHQGNEGKGLKLLYPEFVILDTESTIQAHIIQLRG